MYEEEIQYLSEREIINGYDGNLFKPNEPIKRIQAVQMILREMGYANPSGSPDPGLTDMKPGTYGYEFVAKAVDLGIIGGKTASDGSKYFDTFGTLTRGQMAKILAKAYNMSGNKSLEFTDVSSDFWAYDYVNALAANNVTTGYDDGTFRPNDKLQRQHFAVFMARQLDDQFKSIEETTKDKEYQTSYLLQAFIPGLEWNFNREQITAAVSQLENYTLDRHIYRTPEIPIDEVDFYVEEDFSVESGGNAVLAGKGEISHAFFSLKEDQTLGYLAYVDSTANVIENEEEFRSQFNELFKAVESRISMEPYTTEEDFKDSDEFFQRAKWETESETLTLNMFNRKSSHTTPWGTEVHDFDTTINIRISQK
ncbi:S-layer homology domain-containing protein [Rossellomorea aquimaris]|nr:S-layer homology domain-containing protein [Rossellomorea vietnamensis]